MADQEKTIESVQVDKLKFDIENPRLPSDVVKKNSQEAVLKWMLDQEKVVELMIAIGEKDYFPGEVLLVVENPKGSGTYTVVEGNRRLAAVMLLNNPGKAKVREKAVQVVYDTATHKPSNLPVMEFDARLDILDYLGYRHITGVEPWNSLAKARYLKQLFDWTEEEDIEEKYKSLAKSIGSRSDYVQRLLVGLDVYKQIESSDFFGIAGLSEETISFSVLTTALSYSSIAGFLNFRAADYPNLEIDHGNLKKLAKWIFERDTDGKTRLGESRNLKYLNVVVGVTTQTGGMVTEAHGKVEPASELASKALRDRQFQGHRAQVVPVCEPWKCSREWCRTAWLHRRCGMCRRPFA